MEKQTIRDLIVEGKTKKAIEALKSFFPEKSTQRTLYTIQSEFNQIRKRELAGTKTSEEVQVAKNKIHDKLLAILDGQLIDEISNTSKLRGILAPIGVLLFCFLGYWYLNNSTIECPSFPEGYKNNILIIPFENVGEKVAKPHLALKEKINTLTKKNNLSSFAKIGNSDISFDSELAIDCVNQCDANLIIWGTFEHSDSIRIAMNYFFKNEFKSEDISSKNVMALKSGKMLKGLNDLVLSLCGVIALREGNKPLAEKWFDKVSNKEAVDEVLLEHLRN